MNLIDISSWQSGIDLKSLFEQNDLDGVIVKATQGTNYINPEFAGWCDWLEKNNKPFGAYHYLDGTDAFAEARHFYNTVKGYIGKCVFVADYEGDALYRGSYWLKQFLEEFYKLSGVKCMIYCSLSIVRQLTGLTDYPLWLAQYADSKPVYGFKETPWQSGSVAPYERYTMHQYTSNGYLNGYTGRLDFDKFNGNKEDWTALALGTEQPAKLKMADPEAISEILNGHYGNFPERASNLTQAGYDADSCQRKVNECYAIALSCKKYLDGNMEYLDSIMKIVRLL